MISHNCPVCKTENKLDITFFVMDFVCKSCSNLIRTSTQSSRGIVRKPTENVVLDVGNKAFLQGRNITVVAIIVKKYGVSTFWREYYLKDDQGNDLFLSESHGHWILMFPKEQPLEDFKFYSEFEGKKYRWYESTPNNIDAAAGFFEERLEFKLANYKEFVNGTEMVSWEETAGKKQYFWGKHIDKQEIKKAFNPPYMPDYYGIGVLQPFYFNIKQMINILGVAALMICFLQFYIHVSRANYPVFEQSIKFQDTKNKELVSRSFELSGGSAPLKVNLSSAVDNSWANTEISLVNEKNNEIISTSQDLEYYHGVEDGERWSEGSNSKEINFCGVAPGKYHFLISAEKEESMIFPTNSDKGKIVTYNSNGMVDVLDPSTGITMTYDNQTTYEKQNANPLKQDSVNVTPAAVEINPENQSINVKATWLPVSLWNFGIIISVMALFVALSYWGKYLFDKSKWSDSTNSPFL